MTVHIVVHLFAANGAKEGMKAYEEKALRIFRRHGGEILAAFKPDSKSGDKPAPDEIQILRIRSREDFEKFMNDPDRVGMSDERNRVIAKTEVFISKEDVAYASEKHD